MKDKIGVIFDFNGTCLFDGWLHDIAWRTYIEELSGCAVSEDDFRRRAAGKTAGQILESFLGYELTDNMVYQFSEEKERIYRSLLEKSKLELAPGLENFLNYLTLAGVKKTIASVTSPENMSYYFERYGLDRWFKWESVVIGSGNIPLKPAPDIYLAAIKNIDMPADKIVVFEDSEIGIKSALNAGIKHIIGVTGDSKDQTLKNKPQVYAVINDYTELSAENF